MGVVIGSARIDERGAWATYRQAWRDVPQQAGFPREIVYPAPPGEGETDAD